MLSRLALMVQAAVFDGQFFDPVPPFDDGGVAAEVGVGGRGVAEPLVVAVVVYSDRRKRRSGLQGPPADNSFTARCGSSTSDASARSCPVWIFKMGQLASPTFPPGARTPVSTKPPLR